VLQARKIEVRRNDTSELEKEVWDASDELEETYRQTGQMFQVSANEELVELGGLHESGPRWERARRIVDNVLPPYVSEEQVRVHVVNNPHWNAMALGNYSIYVFGGLMDNVDDDELALVLGHELAHASHEHARRTE